MQLDSRLHRTTTDHADFKQLIALLDDELWNELKEDQATYDPFNHLPRLPTAVLLYVADQAVACGCFKPFDAATVEVKRMFVKKAFRGNGFSRRVLHELERWATELGYTGAVLETSVHFDIARRLYETGGYRLIPNYPPYAGLPLSVCMKKTWQLH